MESPPKLLEVRPLPGFCLAVKYSDGVSGTVDVSDFAGKGVFSLWNPPGAFESVKIGSSGQLAWGDAVELCGDAMYLHLTGKKPEEAFTTRKSARIDA